MKTTLLAIIFSFVLSPTSAWEYGYDAMSGKYKYTHHPVRGTTLGSKKRTGFSSRSSSSSWQIGQSDFNVEIPFGPFTLRYAFSEEEMDAWLGNNHRDKSGEDLKDFLIEMLESDKPLKKYQLDAILYKAAMSNNESVKEEVLKATDKFIDKINGPCQLDDKSWQGFNHIHVSNFNLKNELKQKQIDVKNCILNTQYQDARQTPLSPKDPFTNLVSHCLKENNMPHICFEMKNMSLLEKMKEDNLKCVSNPFRLQEDFSEENIYIKNLKPGRHLFTAEVRKAIPQGKVVFTQGRMTNFTCADASESCKHRLTDARLQPRSLQCDNAYTTLNGIGVIGSISSFFTKDQYKEDLIYGLQRSPGKNIEVIDRESERKPAANEQ